MTFTSVAELSLTAIMICATFRESDESQNLVAKKIPKKSNAVRPALGGQEADFENVNSDVWRQLHSFTTACD